MYILIAKLATQMTDQNKHGVFLCSSSGWCKNGFYLITGFYSGVTLESDFD